MRMRDLAPRALAVLAALSLGASPATASDADGKAIFLQNKCNTCHTVESQAIAQLAADEEDDAEKPKDLSNVGATRKADWIKDWLTKKVEVDGKTHRKRFGGPPAELDVLATWLAGLKK